MTCSGKFRCRIVHLKWLEAECAAVSVDAANWGWDWSPTWRLQHIQDAPLLGWEPCITETRERLEPLHSKAGEPQFGPYFRIYVGNLPRKVDSSQLRQFFSKHGKVADVRVMYHIKTKRSRGFGFVTMATTVDDEPAHVIAMLDGQILDGRPLRVKFAGQK
nr:28 kDa ribonucleoprotein, chloroplastic-like isoform X1 [Setaria viridis]